MKKKEVFKIVNEMIKNNNFYHSIIISSENQKDLENVSLEIVRQIYCSNKSIENDKCNWCLKVINQNNLNTLFIGNGVNKISKEEIKELIIKFSSTGIEDNKNKVYVLTNGENLSEGASNAILKFLEEPPNNTYAIILTNDKNQILPTIRSRCKLFSLENEIFEESEESKILNLISKKDRNGLFEYLIEFKKMNKIDILKTLNSTFEKSVKLDLKYLQEIILDTINEIKISNYINLILENLFIKIYEVI
ncbi:hypothetical protein [Spiroplasma floricola]|uniref:DNA polymerase III subunit delta n=1 Tax=Spiroplasma floricola 23-6 TaxID=1336749 RepID=A0A2K8SC89_9MOLU|nr:hypothetical protein [Spiroplasma floricola]AUB31073.1 DNA polymerase III subunit delta [Spiroplasma floricola 23-6]